MSSEFKMSRIKDLAIAALYEHLLTAEADAYWFTLDDIRNLMSPKPSGALLHIALNSLRNDDSLVDVTYDGGETDLFTLTADGIEVAEEVHPTFFSSQSDVISVSSQPDRIAEIRRIIAEIEEELRSNNETSIALDASDKDLFVGEIAAAKSLTSRDKFRLGRAIALIAPMLRFFTEKFSGAAIGELAKQLLKQLVG